MSRGFQIAFLGVAFAVAMPSGRAAAAPLPGTGSASLGSPRARDEALLVARTAALDSALEQIVEPMDAGRVADVRGQVGAWTGNYRVVEQRRVADRVEVDVEVEIDLPRLVRRVVIDEPRTSTRARIGTVAAHDDCPAAVSSGDSVAIALAGAGLAMGGDGLPLDVTLTCRPLGRVPVSHLLGAGVEVMITGDEGVVDKAEAFGFSEDFAGATVEALELALAKVTPRIGTLARGDVDVEIHNPFPAARVRRVQKALRGVLGVRTASLTRVGAQTVRIRLSSDGEAELLAGRITSITFPDFSLENVTVTAPDAIRLHLR